MSNVKPKCKCKWAEMIKFNTGVIITSFEWRVRCTSPKNDGYKDIDGRSEKGVLWERCVEGKASYGITPTQCEYYSKSRK